MTHSGPFQPLLLCDSVKKQLRIDKLHIKNILRLLDATEHARLQKQYSTDSKYYKWFAEKSVSLVYHHKFSVLLPFYILTF